MRVPTTQQCRRAVGAASLAVALAVAGSACSATRTGDGDPDEAGDPGEPRVTATASPSESPVDACTRQVSYWVGETLRLAPDQGFDYQHMGLSGRTYDVVRAVTAEARAAGRSDPGWVAERARAGCEEAIRATPDATSTFGGWP